MSTELDGVKALLDAHLTNLRSELQRLATNYDQINQTVQSIQRNTNVAIAEIRKDLQTLDTITKNNAGEIKAIKDRIEINEDVQSKRWEEQGILNNEQDNMNESYRDKANRILTLQYGAIGTFITLAIATLWKYFFP